MKKINLISFFSLFGIIAIILFANTKGQFDYLASYKKKAQKMTHEQRHDAQVAIRNEYLKNSETGKVDPKDWYTALSQIIQLNSKNKLNTRADLLEWESQGPDQVGGRTRGFVFDKTKDGRCYTGSVSGGIWVSDNLGAQWRQVDKTSDSIHIMAIGCMTQSKDGDIYAGTGSLWEGGASGDMSSQFNGNGIYKKEANSDEWVLLPSTYTNILSPNAGGKFQTVSDILCDPNDNNIVYAATAGGLHKSSDGGATWTTSPILGGAVGQIKTNADGTILYAASSGRMYKSIDNGATFKWIGGTAYTSEMNGHLCIAPSKIAGSDVVYAVGITGTNNGDCKFVIKSTDAGETWRKIGQGDAFLNPFCGEEIGTGRICQGYYDVCLSTHPSDDSKIFLGGMQRLYTWSENEGWIMLSWWIDASSPPASFGDNVIHSDMHEFAFHPTHPDTMVVVNDGGVYMTYHSMVNYPNKIEWKPRNNKYNVTQFYDMAVNIYGEIIGGAQDNGTQYVSLGSTSHGLSYEISGGDGFGVAISGQQDYKMAFASVYNGSIKRTLDLSTNNISIATGTCADNDKNQSFDGVGFYTRYHLAEEIEDGNGGSDIVKKSLMFVFSPAGFFYSQNATDPKSSPMWTQPLNPGVGEPKVGHHSKDLSSIYIGGSGGLKRLDNIGDMTFDTIQLNGAPCLRPKTSINTYVKTLTGVSGLITGVYVDQTDKNIVVATQAGFGGTNKVFYSTNGTNFTGKQGNLPIMPVYTCVIDPDNNKHVVVGTEFGIWETEDITASPPVWSEQNQYIGRVPVFKLKVSKLREAGCTVLYAGTHGKGFWRVPFPFKNDCDYSLRPRAPRGALGVNSLNNAMIKFDIYPNPSSDVINVQFNAYKNNGLHYKDYQVSIYDMQGRMVKKVQHKPLADNIIRVDIQHLKSGNYIIRLEDDKSVIGGKQFTKL